MSFTERFSSYFLANVFRATKPEKNFPHYMFPQLKEQDFKLWARSANRLHCHHKRYQYLLSRCADFEALYDDLETEASRNVLVESLVFGILGPSYVKRNRNNQRYQQFCELMNNPNFSVIRTSDPPDSLKTYKIMKYKIRDLGLTVLAQPGFIYETIFNHQYTMLQAQPYIMVEKGDVVLDCGACFGDSSLLFAQMAGPEGKVYALECADVNIRVFQKNLDLNPTYRNNIDIFKYAVSDESGQKLRFRYAQGATAIKTELQEDHESIEVESKSIDDFVAQTNLQKLDFMKMDIEGSEQAALRGATKTLQRFRPKLAISVYHLIDDLIEIPKIIKSILPDYQFYLEHHSIHASETVLYGRPR